MAQDFQVGALRPYLDEASGRQFITVNGPDNKLVEKPVFNANATLRKDDWKVLDTAVIKAAKPRLDFVAALRGAGLTYTVANGMGKTVLETEAVSDISPASVSMDGIREGDSDRPHFSLTGLPLPITHKDFQFSARQIAASRNGGSPLDTTTAELAGRQVAEEVERLHLGVSTVADLYKYSGYTIYGLTDFTSGLTKTMTAPTGTDTSNKLVVTEILAMKAQAAAAYHYGPFFCFCSPSWDGFMDGDYSSAYPGITLRDRIGRIEGIDRPKTLDFLPAKTLVLLQKTSDNFRVVIGMDIVTVQWESHGGMQVNFKVMTIMVPQVRADFNGNCGLNVGTHA
jgi:uncharacterized linocin/CFP29 family protein